MKHCSACLSLQYFMSAPLSAKYHYRLHGVHDCSNTRSQGCGAGAKNLDGGAGA